MKKLFYLFLLTAAIVFITEDAIMAQTSKRKTGKIERSVSGSKRKTNEPGAVTKAKKKQEKREAGKKKDYNKFVKENRGRHYEIQTEAVKERMKKNEKEIKARDKARAKALKKANKAGKKKLRKR